LVYGQTRLGTTFEDEASVGYVRKWIDGKELDEGRIAFDIAYPTSKKFDAKKTVLLVPGVSGASTAGYCLEAVH